MKFTVIAVIATLCLVATVNADVSKPDEEFDFEYIPKDLADEHGYVEMQIFGSLTFTLMAALRTLKGLNCSIKGVMNLKASGEKFIRDVAACGGQASKQLLAVINAVNNVINTANSIITLNDGACKNGNYNDETDSKKGTSFFKCFWQMLGKTVKFGNQVAKVVSLSKKAPEAGAQNGSCVKTALNELQSAFVGFPGWIKNCSKLGNNKG